MRSQEKTIERHKKSPFRGKFLLQSTVLAMSYFHGQLPDRYRRRCSVSLLSSERDQVVPERTDHQNNTLKNFKVLLTLTKKGRDPTKVSGTANIDQFALVTLNPYGSSSANRLTPSSSGDLIRNSNLGVGFPLRCFQRLSIRNIATRRYC